MRRSILDPLYAWTDRHPDKLLYAFLDIQGRVTESYSYAQFLQRITDIASHMRRTFPMDPGERVLLAYPPGVEMICAFFACVRLGLIPVPLYPPTSHGFQAGREKAEFIARDCGAAAVLTGRSYYWSMKLNETRDRVTKLSLGRPYYSKLEWIVSTDADKGARASFGDSHSDVLFLQYTSGSTSQPKGVMVTHDNVLENCDGVLDHVPIGVSWLPQYHDMGLIGYYLFIALKGGTTYGFSPIDFIQRPALWLETISKYRGTASSAPNFAYEYCLRPDKLSAADLDRLDLRSLQILMTAAEPVRANVCRDFVRRFEPYGLDPRKLVAAYGLAEYTLAVSNRGTSIRDFERSALRRNRVQPASPNAATGTAATLVSCGRPLAGTEVRIVDVVDVPREAGECEVGEIWIRGPGKCRGYWGRPELSAATFEARLADSEQGEQPWLRTGDLGFVHDDELYICGRHKDMLIVRGLNYYPQDVEVIVETDRHVRKGCVAAFACETEGVDELVVVAELKDPRRVPDARDLNRRVVQAIGIPAASFVFIAARTIPKTSSGKLVRHLVRERWLTGELTVVSQVDLVSEANAHEHEQPHALLRRFGLSGTETWTLAEAGLDSVKLVEFAMALKELLEQDGEHDLASAIDLRVLERIAICELFGLLAQVAAATPDARLRFKRALSDLAREQRAFEAELMRRDTQLRFDLGAPAARSVGPAAGGCVAGEGVLMTGGTGFFGPFLLASLLQQTTDDIYVLVRGNHGDAMRRIGDGLRSVTAEGTSFTEGWERRVRPVCGDLSAANLGLGARAWQDLADGVHTIYHNAALVNYLLDYHAMRDANVGGTNEIVRLAMSRRAKVLNHVSTTFVFGWSVKQTLFETDTNAGMDRLDFGYSQSKWVSEQVVRRAMQEGLQARIFRPALLTPSVHGGGYNFDIAIRLLAFMINHGIGTTAQNQVSFLPADLAADNVVAISRIPESIGATLHLTRDDYASMMDITTILGELTGRTFRHYELHAFVPEVIKRCRSSDILFPLLEFLVRSVDNISAMEFKRYDNSTYRRFRDQTAFGRADPPLQDVVLGILRFLRKHHLVVA